MVQFLVWDIIKEKIELKVLEIETGNTSLSNNEASKVSLSFLGEIK